MLRETKPAPALKGLYQRRQDAYDLEVRVTGLIDLCSLQVTAEDCLHLPDDLGDFLEETFDTEAHPSLEPIIAAFNGNTTVDDCTVENFVGMPSAHAGLLVRFSTPVRDYFSETSWSSGWGHTRFGWVAAPTFEAAWELGCEWAKASHEKDLARFIKQQASALEGGAA